MEQSSPLLSLLTNMLVHSSGERSCKTCNVIGATQTRGVGNHLHFGGVRNPTLVNPDQTIMVQEKLYSISIQVGVFGLVP